MQHRNHSQVRVQSLTSATSVSAITRECNECECNHLQVQWVLVQSLASAMSASETTYLQVE